MPTIPAAKDEPMAELGARFGLSVNVVGQLTTPASARSADSKNSTQRHKIALSIVGHSRISASPEDSLRDYRGSDKQNPESAREDGFASPVLGRAMLETTIAGSLPKPSWLAEPEKLWPAWKLEGAALAAGKIDATILAVKKQEDAGIDIVSDGEQARIHFVHGFLANLDGIDFNRRQTIGIRADRYKAEVPTVTGPIRRKGSVHRAEASAARAHTRRKLKFTLPGPMTIVDTIADEHYRDRPTLAHAFAAALNEEAHELAALGVDVVQFDEPAFNVYMREVKDWGVAALERAAQGLTCTTAVHICYGYGIKANTDWKATLGDRWRQYEETFPALAASRIGQVSLECRNARVPIELIGLLKGKDVLVGCIDVASDVVETPEDVAATIRAALPYVPPNDSILAPIAAWPPWPRRSPTPSSPRWRRGRSWPEMRCDNLGSKTIICENQNAVLFCSFSSDRGSPLMPTRTRASLLFDLARLVE